MGGMSVITEAYSHHTQCERQSPLTNQDQRQSPREASGSVSMPVIDMQILAVTESETASYAVSLN